MTTRKSKTTKAFKGMDASTTAGAMSSMESFSGGFVQGVAIDPDKARSIIESRASPRNLYSPNQHSGKRSRKNFAGGIATNTISGPASIVELARGLKNDPDLIHEYCTTQVDFITTYGLAKAALGTTLDGCGNAFDLADLMVQLLRQAGFTANYVNGDVRLTLAQAAAWFGTSSTDIYAARNLLANGGIPVAVNNVLGVDYLDFNHCWVQVTISGTAYVFDPSFKSYTRSPGLANLATVIGYNPTTFYSNAKSGATTTADYVQNLNRANIRSDLTTMTANLVNWINANNPTASVEDVIGGKVINPIVLGQRLLSLPYQKPGSTPVIWTGIPNAYKATLGIQYDTINITLNSADCYGKRLSIFFNASHQAELRLDGTLLGTSSAQSPGSWNSVLLTATHPYPTTTWNQSRWMRVYADKSYVIANGWGNAGTKLRDIHSKLYFQNLASGLAATSEAVLGEQLQAFYAGQNAENSRSLDLINRMTNCMTVMHHQLGLVGDIGTAMIDIGLFMAASSALDNNYNRVQWNDTVGAMHGVMLEASAIQEHTGAVGVSATTIVDLASQAGQKIFDGKTANWTGGVLPNLVGWDPAILNDIQTYYINAGWRVALPQNGAIALGGFTGYGYWAEPTYGAFGILGGTKGSLGSGIISSPPPAIPLDGKKTGPSTIKFQDGNFSWFNRDLSVGSQGEPYSLSFVRTYYSGSGHSDGPLGRGWTHNFLMSAKSGHGSMLGLADHGVIAGAAAIVELFVANDLLSDLTRPHDKFVIASLASQWLGENLVNNIVNINTANFTAQFVRQPDGSYSRPPKTSGSLVKNPDGTYTYKSPQQVAYNFNSAGDIATIAYPFGVTWTFTYTAGKLVSVSNGLGRLFNFVYTGTRLSSINDGTGRSVAFTVDASKNLTQVTDPNGKNLTYSYDIPGRLFKAFAPANPTNPLFTNTFDTLGQLKQQADAYGNLTSYFYAGYRTEVVNAASKKLVCYMNSFGDAVKMVDQAGNATVTEYDALRRPKKIIAPEGNQIQYTYDLFNNVKSVITTPKAGSGLTPITVSYTYHALYNKPLTVVDGKGQTTTYAYDSLTGNLLNIQRPSVNFATPTISFTYNARGQVLTVTDPTGIVTKHVYDTVSEKCTSVIQDFSATLGHLNLTVNYTYNAVGDVTTCTNYKGNVGTVVYDAKRRVTQFTSPAPFGYVTKFTYDFNDNIVKTERQTNDVGTPWQIWQATYSIDNKIATIKDHLNHQTSVAYNSLRKVQSVTDPLSRVRQYTYTDDGRVSTVTDPSSVVAVTQTYSANGKLASLKDARNNTTLFAYDGFDRPLKTTYPNALFEQVTSYDANGNKLGVVTRGSKTITQTFDALNRLSTRSAQGQQTVTYTYDLAGRMLTAATPALLSDPAAGTVTLYYDTAGRFYKEQYPDGKSFTHQLDANGNTVKTTWPDGYFIDRVFDNLDRLTDVKLNGATTSAAVLQYDALSRRTSKTLENGVVTSYTYNWDNTLATTKHTFNMNTFVPADLTYSYGYDAAGQLSSEGISDAQYSWHPGGSAGTKSYATADSVNQYPSVGGVLQTYNAMGSKTNDGVSSYSFNTDNQIIGATKGSVVETFSYDALDRQMVKSGGPVPANYYYSGSTRMADYSSLGSLQNRFIPGVEGETLMQVSAAGAKSYFSSNSDSSVIALSDAGGNVTARYGYSPFGEATSMLGTSVGYRGTRVDSETGLNMFASGLAYAPSEGRAVQPMLANTGAVNSYGGGGSSAVNEEVDAQGIPMVSTFPDFFNGFFNGPAVSHPDVTTEIADDGKGGGLSLEEIQKQLDIITKDILESLRTGFEYDFVKGLYAIAALGLMPLAAGAVTAGTLAIEGAFARMLAYGASASTAAISQWANVIVDKNWFYNTINRQGKYGEMITRAKLEADGYMIVGEQVKIATEAGRFIADFIVLVQGKLYIIESKFGSLLKPMISQSSDQLANFRAVSETGGTVISSRSSMVPVGTKILPHTISIDRNGY